MNLLIKSGNKELEKNFKNLDNHSVKIVDNISSKDFSNNDCLIIISSLKECETPEELNLKIQDIYNTLSLSVEEGIEKVIMISSLEIFDYEENYTVTESWKKKPKNNFYNLSINLSEIVFKEFGRTFPFQKILLRIGFPLGDKLNNNSKFSCYTTEEDFIKTILKILKINFKNQFEIFHLQTNTDNQRYLTNKLKNIENLSASLNDHFYHPRNKKL